MSNEVVRLDISELSPGAGTIVQRADPFPVTTWFDIDTVVNTAESMSWTTALPGGIGHDRLRLQVAP